MNRSATDIHSNGEASSDSVHSSPEKITAVETESDKVASNSQSVGSPPVLNFSSRGLSGDPGGPKKGPPPPPHVLARIGMKALVRKGALLFFVIWCAGMWIYGTSSGANTRVNNLKVLIRDFDGSLFGQAMIDSVNSVNGLSDWPTFVISTTAEPTDLYNQVYDGTYWASLSANVGTTASFNGSLTDSATYNSSAAFTYYAASARYYTSFAGYINPAILKLLGMIQGSLANETAQLAAKSSLSVTQLQAILDPTMYTFVDVAPMPYQSRVYLNTFGIVISHLSQFFFNMMLNGIFTGVGIYRNTTLSKLLCRKYPIKIIWTLVTSVSITSFMMIFDSGYEFGAKDFFSLWAAEWVYSFINFNTIGAVLVFLPIPYIPVFVFPWVVTSISACLIPIELSNVVYRLSYAYPSHAYWNTVITVYAKGGVNRLHIYLPILAGWIVVAELAWIMGDWTLARRSTKTPTGGHGAPRQGP